MIFVCFVLLITSRNRKGKPNDEALLLVKIKRVIRDRNGQVMMLSCAGECGNDTRLTYFIISRININYTHMLVPRNEKTIGKKKNTSIL